MDLEQVLSSGCRRRIIKVLSENGQTNVMQLILKVNGKYPQVNVHLQILQREQIIFDQHYGRMRVIKLNRENGNTKLLLEALKILGSATTQSGAKSTISRSKHQNSIQERNVDASKIF